MPAGFNITQREIDSIVENIGTVTRRIMEQRLSANELANTLTALDPEIAQFGTVYCSATGKPLYRIADADLSQTVAIHGRKRARTVLQAAALSHRCPQAMYTDWQGLADWSRGDPIGYASYAIGLLAEPGFTYQTIEQRYLFLLARADCYAKLAQAPIEQVIELGELLRRFLSICNPIAAYTKLRKINTRQYKTHILAHFILKLDDIPGFADAIRHNLACIIHRYIADKRATGLNSMRRMMRAALDAAKFELGGMSNFAGQSTIGAFNARDFAAMDFENIWLDEIGVHYLKPKKIERVTRFAAPAEEGIVLSLAPPKESAKPPQDNVFSRMFNKG